MKQSILHPHRLNQVSKLVTRIASSKALKTGLIAGALTLPGYMTVEAAQCKTSSQHAKMPALKKGKFSVNRITKNVYMHSSYVQTQNFGMVGSNGLIYVDGKQAYLIDTPWTAEDTMQLVAWVDKQGLTLAASISTHSHADRTGGVGYLNSINVPTYVSDKTNALLQKTGQPLASESFSGDFFAMLENKIEVHYVGAGHTEDNLVVWLPEHKFLYGGCLVKSIRSRTLGYVGEANIDAWPSSIAHLKDKFKDAKTIMPGHGAIGDQCLLDHTIDLIEKYTAGMMK
ncbi:subclass B1 metallo-beta-lactamase [Shewanella sp. WXL01]|uniref:subclass B1 metallo-beta-lactamase n=1 Tax=Shewanella sp. WXL01 TaxID=2709721 RepID=UPI0014383320|nr:subclass B1 metallo-beta-lactamase [Shewanella sp. WXL01]NKF49927.1 subclass B1 metallo-beta-lactamase [Shewanella sp. WXL01]